MKSVSTTSDTQEEHLESIDRFDSITDMILDNWMQCIEGNHQFVRKSVLKNTKATEEDIDAWFAIYDQYILKYGLGAMYLKLLKIMQKKAILELNFAITGDQFKLTEIAIQEAKLKQAVDNKGQSMSIKQSLIHLSQWMGGKIISTREITAEQYFDLIEEYGKHNKKK